ncbi:MAG TPA: peroxiredoxin [Chloroflexi bacterium]|nr:peroxiredoxin [Chloroflexota bacterium]
MSFSLHVGSSAPDFYLPATTTKRLSLSALRGRPVVLVFYPADFSPGCTSQLNLYQEALEGFEAYAAQLVAISTDGLWSHRAFAEAHNLTFPLLSDFWPHGQTARAYGVFRERDGICERSLFLIDCSGLIRWSYVSPVLNQIPGADLIYQALEDFRARPNA